MTSSQKLQEALVIPVPEDGRLVLDSCRRLLGPNLFGVETGAVGDGLSPGFDPVRMLARWQAHLRALLDGVGWTNTAITLRPFTGGGSIFIPASVDQLFTAAYLIEAAWYFAATDLMAMPQMPRDQMIRDLKAVAQLEANPALRQIVADAASHGVDRLLDDDQLTLGHGSGAVTWATDNLPAPAPWDRLHDVPLALVTGTNGKTTTTRLIAAMGGAAGKVSGLSSTEFVKVGDEILDKGDYSGPAGARLLLRDPRLELAVLEVARGGILRRGLPVTRARAAIVTNVAADHLGQYGIMTVPELAQVKLAVRRALAPGGLLILNADDAQVVAAAEGVTERIGWFSLSPDTPQIVSARAAGHPCGWLEEGGLVLSDGRENLALITATDVPLTLGGAARYNIENALGAVLAARALDLPDEAIRRVLGSFRSDAKDNPGRANEFSIKGARLFVDFAHNPHSIAAVTSALAALPAKRRFVLLGHAGDRSDDDIRALTTGAFALRPDVVVAAENPKYLRGRPAGQIPDLIRQTSIQLGLAPDQVLMADSPSAGAAAIIDQLRPGDLALLLIHDERQKIFDLIAAATD
ncbi:MAG TPA: Mur ligase family protein [Paracoccaceae bacterium]|nr:Mur ligase family protein [Paracoccaceae bacterium]